jgi:hypothetical protein
VEPKRSIRHRSQSGRLFKAARIRDYLQSAVDASFDFMAVVFLPVFAALQS